MKCIIDSFVLHHLSKGVSPFVFFALTVDIYYFDPDNSSN